MLRVCLVCVAFLLPAATVSAQYESWPHRATVMILTTPDGADLPASAREENFPLLVRLHGDTFPFEQARPDGADLRISAAGKPLAYQIESWDPRAGEAVVWVRVPEIRGNARQAITLHWGRDESAGESNGRTVFGEPGDHAVVMHLDGSDDALRDEAGTVVPKNVGTAPCAGIIGAARRFEQGRGIACGVEIAGLPFGAGPCTTEAWLRPEQANAIAVGWGNEQGQGKVTMRVNSPPHIRMECYFSGADVAASGRITMSQWVHVVHAYSEEDSRIYVNGRLEGASNARQSPLNVRTPARLFLGGWYDQYQFVGAIDEVRIARVARSADWIKLCYENQKPQQTLIGTPIQPGTTLTLEPAEVVLDEGRRVTLTAHAGGAEKISWILRQNDIETVVATDSLSYTFDPGRVTRDQPSILRLQAVYPNGAQTRESHITVRDAIPEPIFELPAPTAWNGRDLLEIVPQIRNREAMVSAGAGELNYHWDVQGGAVIRQVAPDRLVLKRSQYSGPIRVVCRLDNGGAAVERAAAIDVSEPRSDPWVERTPDADERPEEGQFYARDDKNEGTLFYNGALTGSAESVYLKVFADDKPFSTTTQKLSAGNRYAFAVKLKPGLIKYRVEFGTVESGNEKLLHTVGNLVCGDAYLIDGQSNALATDTREDSPRETQEWVRSYGGPTGRGNGEDWVRNRMQEAERAGRSRPNLWCNPVWKANRTDHAAELGWWGMELAKQLVNEHQVPIFLLNAAVGGTRIDEHQPSAEDRTDLQTMYGRMLWRLQQARLTHGIRAVLWHQGENDQGAAGPSGGYGWEAYQHYFVDMAAAWKEDMPNIRHYYTFQIWPNACAMGGRLGSGDRLREAQRTLPRLFSNMSIMSTLGIQPPGGCHFPLEGWSEFARLLRPLIDRDLYGKAPAGSITAPNLQRAFYADAARKTIILEFDQPLEWNPAALKQFYLDEKADEIAAGRTDGTTIVLDLKQSSTATHITYLKERDWNPSQIVRGINGIAALTFCDVAIEAPAK